MVSSKLEGKFVRCKKCSARERVVWEEEELPERKRRRSRLSRTSASGQEGGITQGHLVLLSLFWAGLGLNWALLAPQFGFVSSGFAWIANLLPLLVVQHHVMGNAEGLVKRCGEIIGTNGEVPHFAGIGVRSSVDDAASNRTTGEERTVSPRPVISAAAIGTVNSWCSAEFPHDQNQGIVE